MDRALPDRSGVCRDEIQPINLFIRWGVSRAVGLVVALMSSGCGAEDSCPELDVACGVDPPGYQDVAPILERRCVPCHGAESSTSRKRLDEYSRVLGYAPAMQEQLSSCGMPKDGSLPARERALLLEWLACGASK